MLTIAAPFDTNTNSAIAAVTANSPVVILFSSSGMSPFSFITLNQSVKPSITFIKFSRIGFNASLIVLPASSCKSPSALFNLSFIALAVPAAASAAPPYVVDSSFRIIPCASSIFPDSTSAFSISFCCSVNLKPCLDSESIPWTGSSSAFPTACAALVKSIPMTVAISRIAVVASLKLSPLIFLNPSRTFCIDKTVLSLYAVMSCKLSDIFSISLALVHALAPVALSVAPRIALALS